MSQQPLPKGWRWEKLSHIADIIMGQSPPSSSYNDNGIGLPFFQGKAEFGDLYPVPQKWSSEPSKIAEPNDILLSVRAPVGPTNLTRETCCIGRGLAALRAKHNLHYMYLLYYLRWIEPELEMRSQPGSTFNAITKEQIENVEIALPWLPLQRAIVIILNKIDGIQRKQKDVHRLIDNLSLSLFTDIFGDLVTNPTRWEILPLESLGEIVSGVTKGRHLQGKETVEAPYLRVANVQDGYLDLTEVKTIEVLPSEVERYQLQPGDILLTEGGDPDKLGRGYIWNDEIERCIHQNHIFRVRLDQEKVLPLYLATLLRADYTKNYFLRAAKRSSKLASINLSQLKAFPVPVPSLNLQKTYIEGLNTLLSAQSSIRSSTYQDKTLFSSILSHAFTGELTAEWEAANAELIAVEVTRLERRPRLALLDLIALRQRRYPEPVGITRLMKYAFLAQKQGEVLSQPTNHLYDFVPYRFGPFAQDLYDDLTTLETEDWIKVERVADILFDTPERTDILLNSDRAAELEVELNELSDAERADLAAVVDKYGDLSYKELLDMVYAQYPAYARKSRLSRSHS